MLRASQGIGDVLGDPVVRFREQGHILLRTDHIDLALVVLSSAVGIEALARDSATRLIDAHLDGADALGRGFALWGPVALDQPDPDDIDALLARGSVGISIPAGALAGPDALDSAGALLDREGCSSSRPPRFIESSMRASWRQLRSTPIRRH